MLLLKRAYILLIAGFLFPFVSMAGPGKVLNGGMVVNPGLPQTVCAGDSVTLGGSPTASGGTAPYTYLWAPGGNMNNPTDANPHVKVNATTTYTVTVLDNVGNRVIDSVKITVDNIVAVTAGSNTAICPYVGVTTLGAPGNPTGDTYIWTPSTGLSCTNCSNPVDSGLTSTTTYTLIASDGTCHDSTTVTVVVLPPAPISTISPLTIHRGESIELNASGAINYTWFPANTLYNPNTATPLASPVKTTTYTVEGTDAAGCIGLDSVVVNVLDDSLLFFYNTFTPNNDNINDTWYIGNIQLYPNNEVQVFNRYGAQVYQAFGYANQWDGTNLGEKLPDATYYYIVYTGTGQTYRGSITIIRQP